MPSSNNSKQAFWLSIGSFTSFGFGIVSSMILSRFFDKADYGTFKQVLYVYNTLLTVFTLGLPKAYSFFLPRVPLDKAKNLIKKITSLFFILGGVFSLLLYVGAGLTARILSNPNLSEAIKIFAIVPFLMMPTMGLEGILATYRQTKFMAIYTILTRFVMLCCVALPVMFFGFGYKEALIGFVIGSFISCVLALALKYYPVKQYGREECGITFREIFHFSLPLLYASIWGIIIKSSDQFFISRYFGNEVFADFSNGSFDLPFVGMVIGACATVLSPIFSRMSYENVDYKKEIFPIWISVFKKTAMLIYPLVLFCIFFSDEIMVVLYGQQYMASGYYFRVKLITNFFSLIVYAPLIINTGHVVFYSNVHLIAAFVIVLSEYLSVIFIGSSYAIAWISMICHVGLIIIMLLFVSKLFGVVFYSLFPFSHLLKIVLPSVAFLFLEHWVIFDVIHLKTFAGVFLGGSIYGGLFLFYSLVVKLDYFSIIKPIFTKS